MGRLEFGSFLGRVLGRLQFGPFPGRVSWERSNVGPFPGRVSWEGFNVGRSQDVCLGNAPVFAHSQTQDA